MPDASPARKDVGPLIGRIVEAQEEGDIKAALMHCLAALALAPEDIKLCCHAAWLLMEDRQMKEAEQVMREALARRPESVSLGMGLAHVLAAEGRYDEAIRLSRDLIWPLRKDAPFLASYASWLVRAGENAEIAKNLPLAELWNDLHAAENAVAAERDQEVAPPPDARWLRAFFDCFAEGFDERLVDQLDYRGPEALRAAVDRVLPNRTGLFVVDLGCGTGLTGAVIKPYARKLIGVDLSKRMLARAKRRGIYDELVEGDMMDALKKLPQRADLILAGDVLIYAGPLEPLFAQLVESLRPGGCFAATVEKSIDDDCVLSPTRRYAHSDKYIRKLAARSGFDVLAMDTFPLRREKKSVIEGLAFVVGKKS